jgi:hypothetical protein
MWYAASEIIFFLVLAAVIGGLIGYGTAQIYQIDFAALRSERATAADRGAELLAAYEEIADLRRKLQITTAALRDGAPDAHLEPPIVSDADSYEIDDVPPVPGDDVVAAGRRLSERVADAEGS